MNYNTLLNLAVDLGYELAMSGAETFRVEDTIRRILNSYETDAEVFAIPNYLIVTITVQEGHPMTRMRRIGIHGNNLDAVEKLNALSRSICANHPTPEEALQQLQDVKASVRYYTLGALLLGDFLGAAGFGVLFGCSLGDMFLAGICGLIIGLVNHVTGTLKSNPFFATLSASFCMATAAYTLNDLSIVRNADAVNIGALMILVPGLIFTNSLRDIIYGDTNSGINRLAQVLLIATAIAMGTASALHLVTGLLGAPVSVPAVEYTLPVTMVSVFFACIGFSILFNIHGPGGLLCALGGVLSWTIYVLAQRFGISQLMAYFWGTAASAVYAEIMARVRKYPAFSYLVVSIFPLIPGAGVYYAMRHAVDGDMERFASRFGNTGAIAGIMAVAILLVSSLVRLYTTWKNQEHRK